MSQLDTIARPAVRGLAADRVGQGTVVEANRAVAQVEAMVVVAMRYPRDITRAVAEMERSCAREELANKAFYRFGRGGGQVSGPSVQLARELARCFGNFESGLIELRRDDAYRQSEMQAFAWDLERNYRTSTTFIVPHIRDTSRGPVDLTDMRDIYENNANMGARRLREMIFDAMPVWYTEQAIEACRKTLEGDQRDLPQRIEKCIALFQGVGVRLPQLVRKLGSPADKWTTHDLATLTVIYRSLERGEIRVEDEFPDTALGVTAAQIRDVPVSAPEQDSHQALAAPAAEAPPPAKATKAALGKLLARVPLGEDADVAEFLAWRAGRPALIAELSADEVAATCAYLETALTAADGDPAEAASRIWAEYRARQGEHG